MAWKTEFHKDLETGEWIATDFEAEFDRNTGNPIREWTVARALNVVTKEEAQAIMELKDPNKMVYKVSIDPEIWVTEK